MPAPAAETGKVRDGGSVKIDVLPKVDAAAWGQQIKTRLDPTMNRTGRALGKSLSEGMKNGFAPRRIEEAMRDATPRLEVAAARLGRKLGAEIARATKAELAAKLKNLPQANVSVKVKLDEASVERVRRRIANLGPFSTTINVDADTAAAMAKLLLLRQEADRLFGRSVNVNVGANTTGATRALMMLGLQLAALAAIPFGATIAAGIGAIGAAATAAGAGIAGMAAVAIPGVRKVSEALAAQKTAANQVTTATRGQAAALNTAAIASAQAQLRAMQMAQAERQVATAQRAARAAQAELNAARIAGARSLVDMRNGVISAGLALRGDELAVLRAKQALDSLNSSREDAIAAQRAEADLARANADLQSVLAGPKASQLERDMAQLAVESAKEQLRQAQERQRAKELERKEAQLAYEQAVQQLKQQRIAYKRLQEDEAKARKAGVEGTEEVRQAKERLRASLEQVADAQRAVRQQQIQDRIAALQQADAQRQAAAAAGGTTAANIRLGRALASLTPAQRDLLDGWESFSKIYRNWTRSLEPDVLPVLAGGMALVAGQLTKFSPMIRSSSAAFRILETRAAMALDGPFWTRFIGRLNIEAPRAIQGFGSIAGHTLTGVAGVFEAMLPYTTLLLGSVDRLAQRFQAWGTSLAGSAGFIRFMGYLQTTGPLVVDTLGSLGSSLVDVARALAPLAAIQLGVIRTLAEGAAALANSAPGLVQFAAAAFLVSKTIRVLGFTGLIAGLTGTGAAAGVAGAGLVRLGAILRATGAYMMGVSAATVTTRVALLGLARLGAVVASVAAVGYGVQKLQEQQNGSVQSTQALTQSLQTLATTGRFTGAFLDQFKGGALSGATNLDSFRAAAERIANPSWNQRWIDHPAAKFFSFISLGTYNTPLSQATAKFQQLDTTLTQMAQNGQADQAARSFSAMAAELSKSNLSIDQIKARFPQYSALVGSGAFQTQLFTAKIREQNQALAANARAFISDEQEVIDFNNALAAGRTALDTNGRAFWGNSQQAMNNRAAVLQGARVLQSYTDDLSANNRITDSSIKRIKDQRDALVRMAQKFGLSRDEAEKYVDQLVKIPKNPKSSLTVDAKGKFSMKGLDNLGPVSDLLKGITGNAGGGLIPGAAGGGGPRADDKLTRISSGEMVVNAPATRRYLPLLTAINDEGNKGTIYRGQGYQRSGFAGGGIPHPSNLTHQPEPLPAFAGGGVYAPRYSRSYRYVGDAAPNIRKANAANAAGMAGMYGYSVGQTGVGATILSQLLSGGFGTGSKAVAFAQAQLGEPYVWGATGPNSWDCSGLTQAAWRHAGVNIPRVTYDQIAFGTPSNKSRAMPGDLVFPHRGHVMMVTGMGGSRAMIHAPRTGDVVRYAPWRDGVVRHIAGGGGSWYGGGTPKGFARDQLGEMGWSSKQWPPLEALWNRESGWRWNARNPSSGAYGIPQALPPTKMASFGSDWLTNWATQIRWGLNYIKQRYGSPSKAWAHSQRVGWYARGTSGAAPGLAWVGEEGPELVDFRGGERVYPHQQSVLMASAMDRDVDGYARGTRFKPARGQLGGGRRLSPATGRADWEIATNKKILDDLKALIPGLTGATSKIKATLADLTADIRNAFKGYTSTVDDRLLRYVNSVGKALQERAAMRDKVASTIATARTFATETGSKALEFGGLSNLPIGLQADSTGLYATGEIFNAQGIIAGLKTRVTQLQSYKANLDKLARLGVSKDLLAQIIEAGPDRGAAYAQALAAATPSQIKTLNATQAQLKTTSTSVGQSAANAMYDVGAMAGRGFLSGLLAQQAAIEKSMADLARRVRDRVKKELRIRSPSRVMAELGEQVGAGLALGIDTSVIQVQASAVRMSEALVPAQIAPPPLPAEGRGGITIENLHIHEVTDKATRQAVQDALHDTYVLHRPAL